MTSNKPWLDDEPITYGPWLDDGPWDKTERRERRWSPKHMQTAVEGGHARPVHYSPPANPFQALMEAAVGAEPETDLESVADLREALADAFDALPETERLFAEQWLIERKSVRDMARPLTAGGLSVGGTWNMQQRVLVELRTILSKDPRVEPYLEAFK